MVSVSSNPIEELRSYCPENNSALFVALAQVKELSGVLPVSSSNAPLLNTLVGAVYSAGRTFLSGGLNRGVEQQKNAPGGKVKSVYLFTDGLPTVGESKDTTDLSQYRLVCLLFGK